MAFVKGAISNLRVLLVGPANVSRGATPVLSEAVAKTEFLNQMILFGEDSLRRAMTEYGAHLHTERPHQGIGNELIEAPETTTPPGDRIVEHERLGGLLRSYQRAA